MTKKEFFDLVGKFVAGKSSESEKKLLFDFYEKLQSNNIMDSWSFTEEEEARLRLLRRIKTTLKTSEAKTSARRRINTQKVWRVAAIFIGFIVSAYFLFQYSSSHQPVYVPENAITLELENGNIEIIEEDGTTKILNKNGTVVGQQKGNELVYTKTGNSQGLAYNTLKVPYGKRFELQLSDGTRAHLNAGSSFKYPVQFLDGKERHVFISGEAYLDVAKDTEHPFVVHADELNVKVIGTQFNVHAYPEDEVSEIVLVEGSVGLYADAQAPGDIKSTLLEPGYKASFDKADKGITRAKVPTKVYTSWRNGELVFRNMPFPNILKKLERHYAITITNNNVELAGSIFNASFGNEPLNVILESLRDNYGIQYIVEPNRILIN
ncbi:MAG: FecR domain-containing protein [Bacteroidota bacterium]